jgi:hypothetical protein
MTIHSNDLSDFLHENLPDLLLLQYILYILLQYTIMYKSKFPWLLHIYGSCKERQKHIVYLSMY